MGKRYPPLKIYLKSGWMGFLHQGILEMQLLLFDGEDETGVRKWTAFFTLQFAFQFGMFHAERGHMVVVHLILLAVRLDDLTIGVNHESIMLSAPNFSGHRAKSTITGRASLF